MEAKVVVITGASRGMGEDIALEFAKQGAKLVLVARNPEDLERVRGRALEAGADEILTVTTDITKEDEVAVLYDVTVARFGRVDILVNNAGVGYFGKVEETPLEKWKTMFDVNVTGLFLCSRGALGPMLEQGSGHIINISSDVGRRAIAGGAGYCATKFAVQAFSEAMRKEVQAKGVKVTTILPGMTDTYFNNSQQGAEHKKDWLKGEDIAKAVVFAASQPAGVLLDDITVHPLIQEY